MTRPRLPVSPLHLLNPQWNVANSSHHFIAFGVTLDLATTRQRSVHYQWLEQHHQMSQRRCSPPALRLPSCWYLFTPLQRGGGEEKKSFDGIQFIQDIFRHCFGLDLPAKMMEGGNKEVIQPNPGRWMKLERKMKMEARDISKPVKQSSQSTKQNTTTALSSPKSDKKRNLLGIL